LEINAVDLLHYPDSTRVIAIANTCFPYMIYYKQVAATSGNNCLLQDVILRTGMEKLDA
jgi:hypothetical protein